MMTGLLGQYMSVRRFLQISVVLSIVLNAFELNASPRHDIIRDSVVTYIIEYPRQTPFPVRMPRAVVSGNARVTLEQIFDSLGFFNPVWMTPHNDTVSVLPGRRALIDTIIIAGQSGISIDSVEQMSFKQPYDAGEVARLARKTIYLLANQGYPFANLILSVEKKPPAAFDSATLISITFNVNPESRCLFDRARFVGKFETREKTLKNDLAFSCGSSFNIRLVEETLKRLLSRKYIAEAVAGVPVLSDSALCNNSDTAAKIPDGIKYAGVPIYIKDNRGLGIDGSVAMQSGDGDAPVFSGLLNLTLQNLFRRGEEASVYYRGEKLLQQLDMAVSVPHLLKMPVVGSGGFGLEISGQDYGYLYGSLEMLVEFLSLWQTGFALKGHEMTDSSDSGTSSWNYLGTDFILKRKAERPGRKVLSFNLSAGTGTGVSNRAEGRFQRWKIDMFAGMHVPFLNYHAVVIKAAGKTIFTDKLDSLHQAELFRIGGSGTLRGYSEKQFAFKTAAYMQAEYLFYFSLHGSIFVFCDAGTGSKGDAATLFKEHTDMFGYGAGIRIPVKIGTASIAWARNYEDTRGFGRIHIRIQNAVSSGTDW
jgi:outer membrane protein assembly factor BamA